MLKLNENDIFEKVLSLGSSHFEQVATLKLKKLQTLQKDLKKMRKKQKRLDDRCEKGTTYKDTWAFT